MTDEKPDAAHPPEDKPLDGRPWDGVTSVATRGSIPLSFRCQECGASMLYRVTVAPVTMFCGNLGCQSFLLESEVPAAPPADDVSQTHGGCCAGRVCVLAGFPENCSCNCHKRPASEPRGPAPETLSFARLRAVNVSRCVNGFKHTLNSWSVAEWTNAAAGEMGEACNVAKKMLRHRDGVAGNKGADLDLDALRRKLAREIADAVIYADLVCASQGIDLGEAVRETFDAKSEEIGANERLAAAPPSPSKGCEGHAPGELRPDETGGRGGHCVERKGAGPEGRADAPRRPANLHVTVEEYARVCEELSEAAREINCAGPIPHRIRVLKSEMAERVSAARREGEEKGRREAFAAVLDADCDEHTLSYCPCTTKCVERARSSSGEGK